MARQKSQAANPLRRHPPSQADDPYYCIYFYYIKAATSPRELSVYYHFDKTRPLTNANIMTEITRLTENAFHDRNDPPCIGSEVSDLDWRRKAYIVVMVEGYTLQGQRFRMRAMGNNNPHTFSAVTAVDVPVTDSLGTTQTIMGGYLTNWIKHHSQNRDLRKTDLPERFKIVLIPPLARIRYPDSGGTNMGPPIGPP